jgi:hypothetical protein
MNKKYGLARHSLEAHVSRRLEDPRYEAEKVTVHILPDELDALNRVDFGEPQDLPTIDKKAILRALLLKLGQASSDDKDEPVSAQPTLRTINLGSGDATTILLEAAANDGSRKINGLTQTEKTLLRSAFKAVAALAIADAHTLIGTNHVFSTKLVRQNAFADAVGVMVIQEEASTIPEPEFWIPLTKLTYAEKVQGCKIVGITSSLARR